MPCLHKGFLAALGLALRPTGVGVTQNLSRIGKLKTLQSRRKYTVDTTHFFQGASPSVHNFDRLVGMSLFAGNCPHERVLISRLGITLSDACIDVRRAPPFLNRPPHFVVRLGVGTLLQNLEPLINRPPFFSNRLLHPGNILPAMEQPGMNEAIRGITH